MAQRRQGFKTKAGRIAFYVVWVPLLIGGILISRAYEMGFLGRLGVQILAILLSWIVANAIDTAAAKKQTEQE